MIVSAPAKLNLFLHVLSKRPDGYHALESLVSFTDLYDHITIDQNGTGQIFITGPFASFLSPHTNLLQKLRILLRERLPEIDKWDFHLEKNIPIGAGLGGGSADVAAVLRFVHTEYACDESFITQCANKLGSDILVCLNSSTKMMCGRGEEIFPHPPLPRKACVILWPRTALATQNVFHHFHISHAHRYAPRPLTWDALSKLENDLTETSISLCPEISEMLTALHETKADFVRMTGSGCAVFAVYETESLRNAAAEKLVAKNPAWWIHAGWVGDT